MLRPADGQYGLPAARHARWPSSSSGSFATIRTSCVRPAVAWRWCVITIANTSQGNPALRSWWARPTSCASSWWTCSKVEPPTGRFPYQVGIHQSCHGLRGLRLASSSEIVGPSFSKMRYLLEDTRRHHVLAAREAGRVLWVWGTFSINEEAVSSHMGLDRLADHERVGTQVLTAARHVVFDALVGTDAPARHAFAHACTSPRFWPGGRCRTRTEQEASSSKDLAGTERRRVWLTRAFEHAVDAAVFIQNHERTHWHDQALWFVLRQTRQGRTRSARVGAAAVAGRADQAAHDRAAGRLPAAVRGERDCGTASTSIGRATPTNTIRSCWTFCSARRSARSSRASRC